MEDLIIIIGRIKNCSARVLFDTQTSKDTIEICLKDNNGYKKRKRVKLDGKRYVHTFYNLKINKKYFGLARIIGKKGNHAFEFNTKINPKILVASCNCLGYTIQNYLKFVFGDKIINKLPFTDITTNKDTRILESISNQEYDMILHIGDNIYCDEIFNLKNPSYNDFNILYKKHFGSHIMQKILRKGSHIMTCDDHEYVDNIDISMANNNKVINAKQMYLDYQESLWSNSYEKIKILELYDKYIFIPNIEYEKIFGNLKLLKEDIINNIKSLNNKQIIFITSKAIVFDSKSLFFIKKRGDTRLPAIKLLNELHKDTLDSLRKYGNCSLISGELHFSREDNVYYNNNFVCKHYISSGVTSLSTLYINDILSLFKIDLNNITNRKDVLSLINIFLNISFNNYKIQSNNTFIVPNYLIIDGKKFIQKTVDNI